MFVWAELRGSSGRRSGAALAQVEDPNEAVCEDEHLYLLAALQLLRLTTFLTGGFKKIRNLVLNLKTKKVEF